MVSQYLGAAADSDATAVDALELVDAEIKVHAGQYEQALAVLENMSDAGSYPRGLELRRTIYTAQQDWDKLAGLLPQLRKRKLLSPDQLRDLESSCYRNLLQQSVASGDAPSVDDLHGIWQRVPSDLKQEDEMLQAYTGLLLRAGDHATAEKVILRALKQQWHPALVRQFGYVEKTDLPKQLALAENWLSSHPEDPELLLCLGRLSARNKLWGKARDYFESSYRLQRSPEICAELGRLLTGLGEPKVAAAYFREGLLLSESGLPQLPEPEKLLPLSQRLARS